MTEALGDAPKRWDSEPLTPAMMVAILGVMGEGVVVHAPSGEILAHNAAACDILGLTSDQLRGRTSMDPRWRAVREDGSPFPGEEHPAMVTLRTGDPVSGVLMGVEHPGAGQRWIQISSRATDVDGGRHVIATFTDVTELQAASGMAQHLAQHDLLTDVPNRIMFEQLVEAAVEQAPDSHAGCAVVVAGIDHFGSTNKHLGPQGADVVLIETARRARAIAGGGSAVGRIGNDQFAVLIPSPGADRQVRAFAEDLRHALSRPITHESEEHLPSITVGIAVGRSEGGHGLLNSAVEALEAAKQKERGSIRFFDGRDPRERLVYRQSQGIRRAIAARLVRLWYQPIRDLSDGERVGAEALFRVDVAGERVVLTPDLLGVLGPTIARHVLTVLVEDAVAMYDAGTLPPFISVNLTAPDLLSDDVHDQVLASHATLVELGGSLAVEISEQVGLHDLTGVRPAIDSLRSQGIRVALDDFGTGSNSLALLRELPLDVIKLDPSFVVGAMADATDRAIVRAAVALADELHLDLIAEGIENEGILAFIRGAGIHFAQGYLFDLPPATEHDSD